MNRIVTVYPETHMGLGHHGLSVLTKNKTQTLSSGEFLMFLNRAQTAFKLFAANNTVIYYKHPRGRINLEAVKHFPEVFSAGKFSYDRALEKVLDRKLAR